MSTSETPQEHFWRTDFGSDYISRNDNSRLLASNIAMFAKIFHNISVGSVLEIGANIGMNLQALGRLFPQQQQTAIEINKTAADLLVELKPDVAVHNCSIFDAEPDGVFDLVLSKGVLIHLNPDRLSEVYDQIAKWSARFVLFAEYYNPVPVSVEYRGHSDRLFKRDFAGEFLTRNPGFSLRDYGFVYHGDIQHPQDDITWFLLERVSK